MIDFACSTHALAVDTAMFAGPVLLSALALWFVVRRERRRDEEAAANGSAPLVARMPANALPDSP